MTHANVLAVVSAVRTIVPGLECQDVYLAYLPLAHILELVAEVWSICTVGDLHNYNSLISTCFPCMLKCKYEHKHMYLYTYFPSNVFTKFHCLHYRT